MSISLFSMFVYPFSSVQLLSRVRLFVTPWTVARQAPLSMEFSMQEWVACPSTDEWIKKLWYIYTMEYYSAKKSNTSESVLMRWMNLEPIIQSEVSQKEKDKY